MTDETKRKVNDMKRKVEVTLSKMTAGQIKTVAYYLWLKNKKDKPLQYYVDLIRRTCKKRDRRLNTKEEA